MSNKLKQESEAKNRLHQRSIYEHIVDLKPFAEMASHSELSNENYYDCVVRASFSKCYNYTAFCNSPNFNTESSFFLAGSLRSMCEDLIILHCMRNWDSIDRNSVIRLDLQKTLLDQADRQANFFKKFKPGQQVLSPNQDNDALLAQLKEKRIEIWQKYGYRIGNKDRPNTRHICEKLGSTALKFLYEYMYCITSDTVHFNAKSLLRTGWGEIPSTGNPYMNFLPSNLSDYKTRFCKVYSAILLTMYFECFFNVLSAPEEVAQAVSNLRRTLIMLPRWPEMLTFEEMNLNPPRINPIFSVIRNMVSAEEFAKGFLIENKLDI